MPEDKDKRDELDEEAEIPEPADTEAGEPSAPSEETPEPAAGEPTPAKAREPRPERKPRRRAPKAQPLSEHVVRDRRYKEMLEPTTEPLYMRFSLPGLIVGLVSLLTALFIFAIQQRATQATWISLGIGVALVVYAVVTSFQKIALHAGRRGAKVGAHTVILTVLVLAVIVLINWWGLGWEQRWDLTKQHLHSLAPLSVKQLKSIKATKPDEKMQITAFISPEYYDGEKLRELLKLYGSTNHKGVGVEVVDPLRDEARKRAVEEKTGKTISDGTVLVNYKGVTKDLSDPNERRLTSAVVSLLKGTRPKVYFLQGEGEPALDGTGQDAYARYKAALEAQNYEVAPLRLISEKAPRVPDDCKVLVVAGARNPLGPPEMAAIKDWTAANGKLLLLLSSRGPDFHELLNDYKVKVGTGLVLSYSMGVRGNAAEILIDRISSQHPVVEGIRMIGFLAPRVVEPSEAPPPPSSPYQPPQPQGPATSIIEAGQDSWEETDLQKLNPEGKRRGPLSIAVAVEKAKSDEVPSEMPIPPEDKEKQRESPKVRVVVVGNAEFANDSVVAQLPRNLDLALNAVSWLAEESDLIAISPVDETPKTLTLTGAQRRFVGFLTIFILPLAVIAAGIAVWWRRR